MVSWNKFKIPINSRVDRILRPEYVSEVIGTFFLVFTVCINVFHRVPANVAEQHAEEYRRRTLSPLSIGAILMCMIYATGVVSGGHFNPAVTVAVHLVHPDKVPVRKLLNYLIAQLLGGFIGALVGWWIMGHTVTLTPGEGRTAFDAMSAEVAFAVALCFVVLNVATTKQDANNQYFGLAIGFTVISAAFGIGPVSGCALNPAVSFSIMIVHFFRTFSGLGYIIVYMGTPLIGSFIAAILFKIIRRAELYDSSSSSSKPPGVEIEPVASN